jgi:hypothetical protein
MKSRPGVVTAVVVLAMLALALPTLAGAAPPSAVRLRSSALEAQRAFWRASPAIPRTVDPIGPFALSGTVLDYSGRPAEDADVFWGWFDPNAPVWFGEEVGFHDGGATATSADGRFSFPSVTSVPGGDRLGAAIRGDETSTFIDTWANDFSTGQAYVLRPGRVRIDLAHAPAGSGFSAQVGDAAHSSAWTDVHPSSGTIVAAAPEPGFVTAVVRQESDRGTVPAAVGWVSPGHTPVPVVGGEEAPVAIALDWDDAVRGRIWGPVARHSGPPGSSVWFALDDWPAGMQIRFAGFSFGRDEVEYPSQVVTSAGRDQTYRARLAVPADAPPGAIYCIYAYRSDDPQALLEVYDYYLVCDFAASRTTISSGQQVGLRGHVEGNWVTLFKRTRGPAPRPAKLSAPGWTKVRSVETSESGRFRISALRPRRTTWYVARYGGGDFPAFTQVVKVTVRDP